MAAGWSHEETRALVSVWSQSNVQSQLDAVSRNRSVYESIARELSALGYERSWTQCKTKIKNLTQKYRKVCALYFSLVHKIIRCIVIGIALIVLISPF